MPDLLDRVLGEIRERMEHSRAAADEYRRLEAALAALETERQLDPGEERSSRTRSRRRARARAPRGANRDAVLALVAERPGVTAAEAAQATGIARATVSSTLSKLVSDGALERVELPGGSRGFRTATAKPASAGDADEPGDRAAEDERDADAAAGASSP